MVSTNKRRDKDVMKLLVSDFDVNLINDNNMSEFIVKFVGPSESPYEGVSQTLIICKPHFKFSHFRILSCGLWITFRWEIIWNANLMNIGSVESSCYFAWLVSL